MKQLLKTLVLSIAALLPMQPLLAEGLCAPGSCSQTACTNSCCSEMNGAAAHQVTSAACHGTQPLAPPHSAPTPHRCTVPAAQTSLLQSIDPVKVKLAADSRAVLVLALPAPAIGVALARSSRTILASHRERHLLLEVFCI